MLRSRDEGDVKAPGHDSQSVLSRTLSPMIVRTGVALIAGALEVDSVIMAGSGPLPDDVAVFRVSKTA